MLIKETKLDAKLHTGYADFRYGAFVPRWKVQTFLTQMGKSGLNKESIRQADHYFSIWMNQYPWLLSNPPHKANGAKATDIDIAYPETLDHYTVSVIANKTLNYTNFFFFFDSMMLFVIYNDLYYRIRLLHLKISLKEKKSYLF